MRRAPKKIEKTIASHAQRLTSARVQDFLDRTPEKIPHTDLRRRLSERVRSGKGVDRGEALLAASRQWSR